MLLSLSSLTTITEFSLEIIGKIVRKALSNLLRYGIKNLIGLVLNLFGKTSAIRLTYFANLFRDWRRKNSQVYYKANRTELRRVNHTTCE